MRQLITGIDAQRRGAEDRPTKNANLTTVGAACAVLTTVAFVVGIVLMASSGVQVLIPETGKEGLDRSVIDGITFLGFVGFFVWIAAMGVTLLRPHPPAEELSVVPALR